jgi:hypothetical protein
LCCNPRVTGRIAAWNADGVDADMGLQFVNTIKFCFRKRIDDSSTSLGINGQIKCVANAQVKGCVYKTGFIGLESARCIPV